MTKKRRDTETLFKTGSHQLLVVGDCLGANTSVTYYHFLNLAQP